MRYRTLQLILGCIIGVSFLVLIFGTKRPHSRIKAEPDSPFVERLAKSPIPADIDQLAAHVDTFGYLNMEKESLGLTRYIGRSKMRRALGDSPEPVDTVKSALDYEARHESSYRQLSERYIAASLRVELAPASESVPPDLKSKSGGEDYQHEGEGIWAARKNVLARPEARAPYYLPLLITNTGLETIADVSLNVTFKESGSTTIFPFMQETGKLRCDDFVHGAGIAPGQSIQTICALNDARHRKPFATADVVNFSRSARTGGTITLTYEPRAFSTPAFALNQNGVLTWRHKFAGGTTLLEQSSCRERQTCISEAGNNFLRWLGSEEVFLVLSMYTLVLSIAAIIGSWLSGVMQLSRLSTPTSVIGSIVLFLALAATMLAVGLSMSLAMFAYALICVPALLVGVVAGWVTLRRRAQAS